MKKDIINIDASTDLEIAKLRGYYGNIAKGYKEDEADALRAKILNAANTEETYKIKGTRYYVSENGNDENDGLSPETAIKSLDRIEKLPLKDGDAILFERGSIFRFNRQIEIVDGITYGCYGQGVKPALYGSPENFAQNKNWKEVKPNIWQINFDYNFASGCVLDYGMLVGVQKHTGIDAFEDNGDYCHDYDNKIFYLYCDEGNPSDVYESIEIMPTFYLMFMHGSENVVVDNICFKYCSGFAISAPDVKGNITITNCEFGYIGGLWTNINDKCLRFGNAVEFWAGIPDLCIQNILVKNNWFYQTYDSALTWQGNYFGTIYKDITYSENLFEYNNADIEFFDRDDCVLENFVMENNIMRFTSMGWGSRPNDGAYRGIEGCIRGVTTRMIVKSSYWTNNLIDCPARQTINWNIKPEQKQNIHASGTRMYIKSEYRTLEPCLQGLQSEKYPDSPERFACNKQELVEMFPRFEDGAKLYWDEEEL